MKTNENALILTSRALPVPHGFATRIGGVSRGLYATLNLGWNQGDDPANVRSNFERLARSGGFALSRLHTTNQVHGDTVREVRGDAPELAQVHGEGDGLLTRDPGTTVGVKTADCVPLLLVAPDVGAVAAVHSGWRGSIAGIAARAVEALAARGANVSKLVGAIGPSIRRCCYEVSPDLAAQFRARFGPRAVDPGVGGGPHLDLVVAVLGSLSEVGVTAGQVDVLEACTACDEERFFSHRRDAAKNDGKKGLHVSFAECRFA